MSAHRFRVGEAVSANGPAVFAGPYRFTRLLPISENGVPQYHVTSVSDGHDRVLPEPAMRLLAPAANSNEAPRRRKIAPVAAATSTTAAAVSTHSGHWRRHRAARHMPAIKCVAG